MSGSVKAFRSTWTAEILAQPPLIAPARQYTWPRPVPGEEDALARGALQLIVRPNGSGSYLVTCALGFRDPAMPSGVWSCPNPDELCAVAGGYAYIAPAASPEQCTQINLKPVVAVQPAVEAELLLFIGFETIFAWSVDGLRWQTRRLSWEGLRITSVGQEDLRGFGWDLMADEEVEFQVDLRTGASMGGGYRES